MRVHEERDGGIGVAEPMLNLGDRSAARDHRGRTTMAQRMEGNAPQLRSRKGQGEFGLEHLGPAGDRATDVR